jgi:hypothetical protein
VKKEDFLLRQNARNQEQKRSDRMITVIGLAIFLAAFIAGVSEKLHLSVILGLAVGGPYVALLFRTWMEKRRTNQYGLLCPECQEPLTERVGGFAMETGKCLRCGHAVFEDQAPENPIRTDRLSKEEFLLRGHVRAHGVVTVARIVGLPMMIILMEMMILSKPSDGELGGGIAFIYLLFVVTAIRLSKRYALACPHCHRPLPFDIRRASVLRTGKCRHCRETVFDQD